MSGNRDYWKHIINAPGVPWWLKFPLPLMPIVELVGVFTKPIVLMIRLFANITAGHIIALGFIVLIFILGESNFVVGYGVSVDRYYSMFLGVIELLVDFIQAICFYFAFIYLYWYGNRKLIHETWCYRNTLKKKIKYKKFNKY